MGLEIHALRGRGYRLADPLQRLDAAAIRAALRTGLQDAPFQITVLQQVDSTNAWLAAHASGAANGTACLAEQQLAGRGRGGRSWVSPFGRNLYLSMLWRLPARAVSGLSIAVGVCVAEACEALGASTISLKWPNDLIVVRDGVYHKLGGILVDVSSDARHGGGNSSLVIIGIGLNVDMPAALRAGIAQPVTDLNELTTERVSRNALAAQVMQKVILAMPQFELQGLAPFRARFGARDANLDRVVRVEQSGKLSTGLARGIDESGALMVETSRGLERIYSGDVSLRATT
jgi:BirA family biotin operon repressor/biotin-[acetyl-CoA-carboxylase] ligase